MKKNFFRDGQSLIEILVAIGVGTIMILGAITALTPAIKSATDVNRGQAGAALAKELLDGVRVFAEANWHNLDSLATSSANKYFLNVGTSTFLIATGTESIAGDSITSGLVGYWKLDDTSGTVVLDFSPSRNYGNLSGAPAAAANCEVGKCLKFSAVNDAVNTVNSLNLPSSFTLSNWINTASATTNMYSVGNLQSANGYALGLSGGLIAYAIGDGTADSGTCGSTTANDGKWHLLTGVFTRVATTTFDCYLDGAKAGSAAISARASMSAAAPKIGNIAGGNPFNGWIDDVRIYNRALSASEIYNIYNATVFFRDFYLDNVYRDSGGNIVSAGGGLDPSTKKVTVEYYWGQTILKTVFIYLTRSVNRTLWQTDWSGGPNVNGPASTTGNMFTTSSNLDYSTTTGAIRILGL